MSHFLGGLSNSGPLVEAKEHGSGAQKEGAEGDRACQT